MGTLQSGMGIEPLGLVCIQGLYGTTLPMGSRPGETVHHRWWQWTVDASCDSSESVLSVSCAAALSKKTLQGWQFSEL